MFLSDISCPFYVVGTIGPTSAALLCIYLQKSISRESLGLVKEQLKYILHLT